jgi:uncharacterized DUF497 family protein
MIKWNQHKNNELKDKRGISFDIVAELIQNDEIVDILENRNYPDQMIFVVILNEYVYAVPFVFNGDDIFLKTIYPSRKLYKRYMEK